MDIGKRIAQKKEVIAMEIAMLKTGKKIIAPRKAKISLSKVFESVCCCGVERISAIPIPVAIDNGTKTAFLTRREALEMFFLTSSLLLVTCSWV